MSRSIDLFIATERPLADVAAAVSAISGVTPAEEGEAPGTYVLVSGDVRAELGAHSFIDDRTLPLSRYPLALSCSVPTGTRLSDAAETLFLRAVSEGLQGRGYKTLLVHDLQYRDGGDGAPSVGDGTEGEGAGA